MMVKFVDHVGTWWRWFSTWLLATSGAMITAYETFPQLKAYVPDKWFHITMGVMLFLIFLARIVKQSPPPPAPPVAPT